MCGHERTGAERDWGLPERKPLAAWPPWALWQEGTPPTNLRGLGWLLGRLTERQAGGALTSPLSQLRTVGASWARMPRCRPWLPPPPSQCLSQARAFVAKLTVLVTSAWTPIDRWGSRGQPPAGHMHAVPFLRSHRPLWATGGLPFEAQVEESTLPAACWPAVHGAPWLAGTMVALCVTRRVT